MRRWVPWILAFALWPTGPSRAADEVAPLDLKDGITDVTVYPDRAMVTRTARLNLTSGLYALRFPHLPGEIQPESLRVRLLAGSEAVVRGFDLRMAYQGSSPAPRITALTEQLRQLAERERTLKDSRAVEERQLSLAQELLSETASSLTKVLSTGKANLKDWPVLLTLLKAQHQGALVGIQAADRQLADIAWKRRPFEQEVSRLKGYQPKPFYQVPLTLEVKRAGTVAIALDYLVPGARWQPSYDARLGADSKHMDWEYHAQVSQQTGEDWKGVRLSLSTAAPAEGCDPPEIGDWFLAKLQPRLEESEESDAPSARKTFDRSMASGAASSPGRLAMPQEREALVVDQGTSVTLEVPDPVSIPGDGQEHRALVGHAGFDVTAHYRLAPKLSPSAFLEVEAPFPGPWPLLPGPVKSYVGLDYVGTTELGECVPGQLLTLPMGIDRAVRIKRRRLALTRGTSGLIGKVRFAEYRYELALDNHKPTAQHFTVLEPFPQTTLQEISIKLLDPTPALVDAKQPGQLRWDVELPASGHKVLKWGYRVEYPMDMPITGLE